MSYKFQAIDWWANDINIDYNKNELNDISEELDEDGYYNFEDMKFDLNQRSYIIKIFGRMEDGKSISVNVVDFKPYFYVKLEDIEEIYPDILKDNNKKQFEYIRSRFEVALEELIPSKSKYEHKEHQTISKVNIIKSKDMWGFNGRKEDLFIEIHCHSFIGMKMVEKKIRLGKDKYGIYKSPRKLKIYESNIEPLLRFMHLQDLNPSGWIEVKKDKIINDEQKLYEILESKCDFNVNVSYNDVLKFHNNKIAPFNICSWDIECTSSHGDFPVAKKDYMKVARDIVNYYNKLERNCSTNISGKLISALYDGFMKSPEDDCEIGHIFPKNNEDTKHLLQIKENKTSAHRLERRIEKHINDIMTILKGGIIYPQLLDEAKQAKIKEFMSAKKTKEDDYDYGINNYNEELDKKDDDDDNDEQGYSTKRDEKIDQLIHKFASIFPKLEGDEMIQIGMVIEKCGTNEREKIMLSLKDCDEIQDVQVYSFNKEKTLIKKFANLINEKDIDIMTGFNIFGFDYQYVVDRADELGVSDYIAKMSKFKYIKSVYTVKQLASSALGQNELKYIDMKGRVLIDIMKIVQRDHKLDYYNLDHISSTFMNGKIKEVLEIKEIFESYEVAIKCKVDNLIGLSKDNYVKIDGSKYKVLNTYENENAIDLEYSPDDDEDEQIIKSKFNGQKWGMAKDDITPKEIFQCYRGTSADRALVAKYCIKDSDLCIDLMNKMKLIPQNFGMASVCSVPVSYIIMRGQGVKVFSLVTKVCNLNGYRVPVINKGSADDDSYEGAIVLVPEPGIYVNEPVAVNDYASLYPSSMISENISHDSIVLDEEKYGNLPNTHYVNITYDTYRYEMKGKTKIRVPTGQQQTCRFAQFMDKDGNKELGILPLTLKKLLTARKNTRKQILEKTIILKNGEEYKGIIGAFDEIKKEYIIKLLNEGVLDSGERYTTKKVFSENNIEIMKDSYNEFECAVLDGLQLAYKVTANSVYGQVGARTSSIYLKELAASTTATGRNLILSAKAYAEEKYGAHIVYGDSVPFDEPIIIKYPDGKVDVRAISDIVEESEWKSFEAYKNSDFIVTIRAMLVKILLDGVENEEQFYEYTEIIPKWLRKKAIENREVIKIESVNKWRWEIQGETEEEKLEHINKICEMFIETTKDRSDKHQANPEIEVWTDNGWQKVLRLIKHKTNKKMFRISTGNGIVDVTEDHSLCDSKLNPIKPGEVEIGKTELLHHQIDTSLFKEIKPIVPAYPGEYWNKVIQIREPKYRGEIDKLYECSKCSEEYDGSLFSWYFNKKKNIMVIRNNICRYCIKKNKCEKKGKKYNGLLNVFIDINTKDYELTKDEAWVWGFFMGDGSCNKYNNKSGIKYNWEICNQNVERLNRAKEILEKVEPEGMKFIVRDTLKATSAYRLAPLGASRYMVIKYRTLFYDKFKQKNVPQIILNASYDIRKAFFDGYYEADGRKTGECEYKTDENCINTYNKIKFTAKGKTTAQGLYLLVKSIGFKQISMLCECGRDRIYTITSYKLDRKKNRKLINKIKEIPMTNDINVNEKDYCKEYNIPHNEDYVYDIETATGRFSCGVGDIILNNTDSLFTNFPKQIKDCKTDKERLEKSIQAAQEFGEQFRKDVLIPCTYRQEGSYKPPNGYPETPHDFEYEKTFYPFIIFSKKRYVGNLYETNANKYYFKCMGVVLKRRDNAKIVKHIYGGLIDIILKTKNVNNSLEFLKTELNKLINGEFPMDMLTITKVLNGTYKDPERIPQKALADRMKARDPGSAPQVNDRVPYAFVKLPDEHLIKGLIQADKVEHPKYIQEHNLPIDYEYYILNQLMKPILQLFALNVTKLDGFNKGDNYFKELKDKYYNEYNGSEYRGEKRNEQKVQELTHAKVEQEKAKEVTKLLFEPILEKIENSKVNLERKKQADKLNAKKQKENEKEEKKKLSDIKKQLKEEEKKKKELEKEEKRKERERIKEEKAKAKSKSKSKPVQLQDNILIEEIQPITNDIIMNEVKIEQEVKTTKPKSKAKSKAKAKSKETKSEQMRLKYQQEIDYLNELRAQGINV